MVTQAIITLILAALPHLPHTQKWKMIWLIFGMSLCLGSILFVAAFYGLARAMGSTSGVTSTVLQIFLSLGVILASGILAFRKPPRE